MRSVLVLVLVAGCAVDEADDDPRRPLPPCAPLNLAQILEPLDTTVPAPAVNVVVRWRTGPDGVIAYHYTLPPSTAFDFEISEFCYDGDATMPRSHTYRTAATKFRTGP